MSRIISCSRDEGGDTATKHVCLVSLASSPFVCSSTLKEGVDVCRAFKSLNSAAHMHACISDSSYSSKTAEQP